jgi:hypothetical protein
MVTLDASPPNAATLSFTHLKANLFAFEKSHPQAVG